MKTLTEKVIPMTTLLITIMLITVSISNLIYGGGELTIYINILQFAGCFFLLSCIEYFLLGRIEFKSALSYNVVSFMTWYVILGACNFGLGWSRVTWKNLAVYTLFFIVLFVGIQKYSYYRLRRNAEEINRLLEKSGVSK